MTYRTTFIASILALGAAGAALAQAPQPRPVGVARAVAAAEAALGARAFEAELDRERGGLVYEIDLVKDGRPVKAEVDATTGEVTRSKGPARVRLPFGDDDLKAAMVAPRTLSQTIAMVEEATKGRVTDIDLERERGRHYYKVELAGAQDRDVLVDLQTGAITPVIDD
jgi:uncharacterized membrane protein YkoI